MISSGIFILPGLAFAKIGPAVFVSYFFAGTLALIGILSVIELATAMPKAGGDYYFITRSMGPLIGTVSGFFSWFALSLKSAFAVWGLSEVIFLLIKSNTDGQSFRVFLLAVSFTIFFMALNYRGVHGAAKFEVALVVGLLLLMGLYVVIGIGNVSPRRFDPFVRDGASLMTLISTSGFVFVSFGGLLNVASVSEEIENPKRNIPLALVSSVGVITVTYALLLIVTVGVSSPENLSGSMTPIADAAAIFAGKGGYAAVTLAAILAFLTTANAGIMAASRYPLALGRDKLIPDWMSAVSEKRKTPTAAILITGGFIILSLLMPLETMVKMASTVILTSYVLSNAAVIVLRESGLPNYRPSFRCPLYPWIQIISIILFLLLIIDMGAESIEISMGLLALSLVFYYLYGRKASREYALLHVIERITDKSLTTRDLATELKNVIHARDEIVKDDFDHVVERAEVRDLDSAMTLDQFFGILASDLREHYQYDTVPQWKKRLFERENESSTAITPFLAIPHLIVDGTPHFDLFLFRCHEGIHFSKEHQSVKAIFAIAGTRGKRNLHLRALAAIAQLTQNPHFERRWLQARNDHEIRDVILLGERGRSVTPRT